VSNSAEQLAGDYFEYRQANPGKNLTAYVEGVVTNSLGIHDVSPEEIAIIVDTPDKAAYTYADIISRRAQTGWSTHGHSG
jgi:alkaline phosphatase